MPRTTIRTALAAVLLGGGLLASAAIGRSALLERLSTAGSMAAAADRWLATLAPEQTARAQRPFDDPRRTDWHFIPKFERKGLQLREMTPAQAALALDLLRSAVSQAGYDKARGIMELDELLRIQEGTKAKNIRDPQRYFFTIFGKPSDRDPWALSVEGHHLSLNFAVREGRLVDSTPQFLGANPAVVRAGLPGLPPAGQRILRDEETLAFELVRSLDAAQRAKAVIAPESPKDIRAAGSPQPPADPPVGVRHGELSAAQRQILRKLIDAYCTAMVPEVAEERLRLVEESSGGWDAIAFAWAGPLEPGIGHYYRVEGPTFSIEFVNVQPDAEGNPANHIHCVWRDRTGDFDLPATP
jgi:hypothetical protein